MLRRTFRRSGHQLIPEPLGNEHDTLSRGRRTYAREMDDLNMYLATCAVGAVGAVAVMYKSYAAPHVTVSKTGVMTKLKV